MYVFYFTFGQENGPMYGYAGATGCFDPYRYLHNELRCNESVWLVPGTYEE